MPKRLLLVLAALLAVALIGCGKTSKKSERGTPVEIHLKLEAPDDASPEKRKDIEDNFARYRDETIEIIRKRLEAQGMPCDRIAPEGERGIAVRTAIPEGKDERMLKNLFIGARLEFRLVHEDSDALVERNLEDFQRLQPNGGKVEERDYLIDHAPPGCEYMWASEKSQHGIRLTRCYVYREAEMDGRNIKTALPDKDSFGIPKINLRFNSQGAADFERVTEKNIGRQLAIVLDGKLCSAPGINEKIASGMAVISGNFSEEEAVAVACSLPGGALPLKVTVVSVEKR